MEGKITSVSGSVVVVSDLEDLKMNDIVFVGDKNLVGEIVKIEGSNAIVQVYEDTSGLRIGESATDTKEPLSVELGPGLIGSIFDGIQRPLDKILNEEGTFMGSGIKVNSLDREKKWHFKPKTEIGKEVNPGEEIGEVKETSLIKHKVLIPGNKKGKIKKIVEEGDYTIEETIAIIENEGKTEEIKLMTKWPVRIPRPVKEKLPPNIPLLTGQRVIDTMFPIAMGGTAAVPGPFGSGKCITGDTPIALATGEIKKIETIYHESFSKGEVVYENKNETLIRLNAPLKLYSFYNGKVAESESRFIYKGKSDSVLKIKTRTGRMTKVTPVHKLFKLNESGEIKETPAKDLREGDYIVSIRKIKQETQEQKIDVYMLEDARTEDNDIKENLKRMVKAARKQKLKINLDKRILQELTRNNMNPAPKLSWIKEIYSAFSASPPKISVVRGERYGKNIKIPEKMDEELSEFIGLYIAEGYIREEETVVFTNSDAVLLNRFLYLTKKLFGIDGRIERQKNKVTNAIINSVILSKFIKQLMNGGYADTKYVPEFVLKADDKILSAFLKGYYLGDGSYYKGQIELSTASKRLQLELSYILTRLGIMHSLKTGKSLSKNYRNRVFIRNLDELNRVYNVLKCHDENYEKIEKIKNYIDSKVYSYTSIGIVPLSKSGIKSIYKKYSNYAKLKSNGIEISNYVGEEENFSANSFKRFVETISSSSGNEKQLQYMNNLYGLLDFIYFDKITEIKKIKGPLDVYDFVTPEFGSNFVGGEGAMLLHNTVIQHQLAKWSDADVIVYVGCGERGNEMTEILTTFPELKDPKSGKPIMDRTILIANTSNMPVAAREASIYTGITLAEYYRDMGYSVAVMADSTSRWAEALRELSGRLEEMPGEEGYPAYLGRRIGEFYERSGRAKLLSGKVGSATIIGAVSPPGGDISEPVSQNTLRVTRVFWALDASLANARHFPSINWLNSYSLYTDGLDEWYRKNIAEDWPELRNKALATLQKEAEINEIVQLVGYDALPESDKLILDVAKILREDYLQQNAYDDVDTYASSNKQYKMLKIINEIFDTEKAAIEKHVPMEKLQNPIIKETVARLRYTKEEEIDEKIKDIEKALEEIKKITAET